MPATPPREDGQPWPCKPPALWHVCEPGLIWEYAIEALIDEAQGRDGKDACPPWGNTEPDRMCPLKPREKCPGEKSCWVWYAYEMGKARICYESQARQHTLTGQGEGKS